MRLLKRQELSQKRKPFDPKSERAEPGPDGDRGKSLILTKPRTSHLPSTITIHYLPQEAEPHFSKRNGVLLLYSL